MQRDSVSGALYSPAFEKDGCGFGLIAHMDGYVGRFWLVKPKAAELASLLEALEEAA